MDHINILIFSLCGIGYIDLYEFRILLSISKVFSRDYSVRDFRRFCDDKHKVVRMAENECDFVVNSLAIVRVMEFFDNLVARLHRY